MTFREAYYKMMNGAKIRYPDWGGYWAWENNTIMIHCRDGNVLDIRDTENVAYTFSFIAGKNWLVAENKDIKIEAK